MAYAAADITATEIADAALDKPLTVGTSVIEGAKDNSGFDVMWNADGDFATGDDEDTSFPHKRSYDRHWHIVTKAGTAATENWLIFKAGTSLNFGEFDTAVILGHNLGANSCTLSLQVSDDPDVKTNGTEIATWTPAAASGNNEARLVSVDLDDGANANPQSFTALKYVGLKITQAGSIKAEIGDVWLGKRRQMPKKPRLGYNPDFSRSNVARFQSESMVTTSYVRARGQQVLTASMTTTTAAAATVMTTFYNDIEEGTKSFVWVEKPNASPTVARVMLLDSPELHGGDHIANTSATNAVRPWTFQMSEQAPFLDREG